MAATATTVGDVIDYLLANIPTWLDDDSVQVVDGCIGTRVQQNVIIVGDLTAPIITGAQDWATTGLTRDEDYTISCQILTAVGGTNQKPARDAGIAIFKAIDAALVNDQGLGGLINRSVNADRLSLQQTHPDEANAGRQAVIDFVIHVKNRIQRAA